MIDFKLELAKKIAEITNLNVNDLTTYIEVPPDANLGDYAFPCFRLAKELKKAPPIIAQEIKEKIDLSDNTFEKIDIVGGYLNVFTNKNVLIKEVLTEISVKKETFGSNNIGRGKTAVVEYSSPNIAKPFHIGHLRTTVIGGALYKIYKFLGYNTVGINYLGDWGLQFGKVMAGYKLWKDEYDFSKSPIDAILQIYIRFSAEEKENEELTNLAREWFKKLENKDEEANKLWEYFRKISLENYEKTYNLLSSKFDSYNGEAYYNDKMDKTVESLKQLNLLKESQSAQIVDLEEYNMPPCIVITSAGTTIYATRDITALIDRINTYKFDKLLYVVGNEQALHFQQIFKVVELMGYEEYVKKCEHISFGLVVDKNGEKIGSRKGNSVSLEDILNESIDKVRKIIDEKNPDIKDKEEVAKKVGVGAIIFNDLSNNRIKDEIFDWNMILNFNGETGPYIQYIFVRTKSVLNKAGYLPNIENIKFENLLDNQSINVLKLLYNFKDVVSMAGDKNEPSIISRYLIDLAQSYSTFYNENHILVEEENLKQARLYLTYATNIVLETGANLLGIQMPEEM